MEVEVLPGKIESRANHLIVPPDQVSDIVGFGDLNGGKHLAGFWGRQPLFWDVKVKNVAVAFIEVIQIEVVPNRDGIGAEIWPGALGILAGFSFARYERFRLTENAAQGGDIRPSSHIYDPVTN